MTTALRPQKPQRRRLTVPDNGHSVVVHLFSLLLPLVCCDLRLALSACMLEMAI